MTPPLLLDACAVINLRAAGLWSEVSAAVGWAFAVTRQVARETLFTLGDEDERERIDLEDLIRCGGLDLHGLIDEEVTAFVELARELGDGEASTLAMASARGWPVATDDRKARRIAGEMEPRVKVLTTPDLIKAWAKASGASMDQLERAVSRIRDHARYVPSEDEPGAGWWHDLLRDEAA